ncbi:NTP transferase domain-containing protein [Nocardioides zeae]|uniref:NTP transferase domain-containing protein n=1 Tax=Nocardioides imazamoxiresistens TaxID=3231893 RepID=A0ABU3PY72_9ACTN|nr:NTP transferase domain-containing protein [Nocardioides zeae]MDT9594202.1 NTP transferase domain-containing protein [Nocardioides zeae]
MLAAGAGRRMGRPKALVDDWLERSVRVLLDGGCDDVTVVLGARAQDAVALLDDTSGDVHHVVAADWAEGMGASLRTGLAAVADADAVLVHLVDLPDVGSAVVRRVLEAWHGPTTLARAAYGDPAAPRLGHPVLLGREHLDAVRDVAVGDRGARDHLAGNDVRAVWCGDLAGGDDVDSRGGPDLSRP